MLPASLQAEGENAMNFIFDFWKRQDKVTFYKSATEVVVSSDPDWNADFANPYASNIVKTAQKAEFECRYWYVKDNPIIKSIDGDDNANVQVGISKGKVRLQMRQDGFDWLGDTKSFWIEGEKYTVASDKRRVGIFGTFQFFEIMLEKDQ